MKKISMGIILVISLFVFGENLYGEKLIRIKGISWISELEGDITSTTKLLVGTELSLTRTLNLEEKTYIPEIELKINLPLMGKLIGSYWQATYEGNKILPQDINFYGRTYSANEFVQTELNAALGTLLYQMTFLPEFLMKRLPSPAEIEGGLLLGVKYFHTKLTLTSSVVGSAQESFGIPIPLIGLLLQVGFLKMFKAETSLTVCSAKVSNITARFLDFYAEGEVDIGFIPIGIGYKLTDLNFGDQSSHALEANLNLKGLYFRISFEF